MNWADAASKRFLSVKDVANEYGLAVSTVYKMASQHRIPFVKMGRRTKFDRLELNKWVSLHTVKERH
jgi:excisionase family DNA binding protein